MKIKIQIKTLMGLVLFELEKENNSLKETLKEAVKSGAYLGGAYLRGADLSGADLSDADLSGADLRGADLRGAYLRGADLSGADLRGADLSGADLSDAYLRGADLSGADLSGAYLSGADLSGADLSDADLSGADLSGAYLRGAYLSGAYLSDADLSGAYLSGADLSGAYLSGADLSGVKEDLYKILDSAPFEVEKLLQKMKGGKINGSVYEGECACLVGTIANIKQCSHRELPGIIPDSSRPAERWFLSFKEGATPEKSSKMKITVEWVEEWLAANKEKLQTV
jgi:uncharacterized protein YjbI with pentapeptide repeats